MRLKVYFFHSGYLDLSTSMGAVLFRKGRSVRQRTERHCSCRLTSSISSNPGGTGLCHVKLVHGLQSPTTPPLLFSRLHQVAAERRHSSGLSARRSALGNLTAKLVNPHARLADGCTTGSRARARPTSHCRNSRPRKRLKPSPRLARPGDDSICR